MDFSLLKDEVLSLPIIYTEGRCEDVLISHLNDYFDLLYEKKLCSVFTREVIDNFNKSVKKMFEEYYLGHHNKAYVVFKEALKDIVEDKGLVTSKLPKKSLYRARINYENQDFRNDEMFHIKFDSRSKVKTQRFSFPGLPCLYLGSSSYVCWLELDRPSFDQFQVATIKQRHPGINYKVIDLCIHPFN